MRVFIKNIVVGICGILVADGALCGSKSLTEPKLISDNDLRAAWGIPSWDFNTSVAGEFMLASMIGEDNQLGACGEDEGAGVAIIATDIFSNGHGAKFCARQIQSANGGGDSWIDFYDTKSYKCNVLCKKGWYGDQCNEQRNPDCSKKNDKDYTSKFNDINSAFSYDTSSTYCDDTSKIKTSTTPVFHKLINHDNNFSQAIVLGVLKVQPHGIVVGPVDVHVHKKNRNHSWITSVKGNNSRIMLCAEGWVPNQSNDDCVLHETCEAGYVPFCDGVKESNFNASQHVIKYRDVSATEKCRYFVCQSDDFGFMNEYSTTCTRCERTKRQGVNTDGICETCPNGKFFIDADTGCQTPDDILGTQQLIRGKQLSSECWRLSDPVEYKECVLCPGGYNQKEKRCYI